MHNAIPSLATDAHGLADGWEHVQPGEYRLVTITEGPLAGKDVLVQKRDDGTALIHLMPDALRKGGRAETLPVEGEYI